MAFTLPPLPYAYDALEPAIDKETMTFHHDKHHQTYVDNLNKAVDADASLQGKSLEDIFANISKAPKAVRNNGGGHWNHSLFWELLAPVDQAGEPSAELAAAIDADLDGMDKFKEDFNAAGAGQFGSGWAWLIVQDGKLKITSTPNQDNPLMDVADQKGDVVLGAKWNTAMGLAGMGFGFAGIFFFSGVARRFGKRNALALVLSLAICAFIGDWWFYNPEMPYLQLLACGCVAFTGAGFWTLYGSVIADVIDADELETEQRREGSFSACQSWISKVGIALGFGASGWILQFTGFDSKLPVQSEHAIFMMRILLSGIPVVGLLIALVAILRYPLTETRMFEIRTALEARRGKV